MVSIITNLVMKGGLDLSNIEIQFYPFKLKILLILINHTIDKYYS